MKKLLLGAAALLFTGGLYAQDQNPAKVDDATYAETDDFSFKNLWIRSASFENRSNSLGSVNGTRGMALKDGKMYFCNRETVNDAPVSSLIVYDALTGNYERTIQLPSEVFKKADGSDTEFPCNDIQVDDAGNLLVSNMTTNMSKTPFQVWKITIDGDNVTAKKVIDYCDENPDGPKYRIDAFGVFGNVDENGYIMAAFVGAVVGMSDYVIRWDIVDGVQAPLPDENWIQLKRFLPGAAVANGDAPRICPISEELFYLDGNATYATLYDMEGNLKDGFEGDVPTDLFPISPGTNGVAEFQIEDRSFIVYACSNTDKNPPVAWDVCELDPNTGFLGMKRLYRFPEKGMGTNSCPYRSAVPSVEVNDNVATISVYAGENGIATYQLTLKSGSAINETSAVSDVVIRVDGNRISFSETVANAEVFAVTGQQVAGMTDVREVIAPVAGIYVVKIIDNNGVQKIQKVAVK